MARTKPPRKSEPSPELEVSELGEPEIGSDGEEIFHVEAITGARVVEDDDGELVWQYFIKWAFYPDSASSWEPVENVQECQRLVDSFWDHVGPDNNDYEAGYEVHAKKAWIKKETDYFKRTYVKNKSQKDIQKEKDKEKTKGKAYRNDPKDTKGKGREPSKGGYSKKGKSKRPFVVDSDSGSGDNKPLMQTTKRKSVKIDLTSSDEELAVNSHKTNTKADVKSVASSSYKGKSTAVFSQSSSDDPLFSGRDSSPEMTLQSTQSASSKKPEPQRPVPATANPQGKKDVVPAHRQRKANPLVKQLNPTTVNFGRGSNLVTKARLTQKPTPTIPNIPSFMGVKNAALSTLTFKKNIKKPQQQSTSAQTWVKRASLEPQLPALPPRIPTPVQDIEMQDTVDTLDQQEPLFNFPMDEDSPALLDAHPADDFLASIIPAELAAPIRPYEEDKPRFVPKAKPLAADKILKDWKWAGELFVSVSEDQAERLCEVAIQETTEPQANAMRFSFFFQKKDSLRLKKLHDVADLNLILPSCNLVQQAARLVPGSEKDKIAFEILAKYMTSQQKITYTSLSYLNEVEAESDIAGILLVFPPFEDLCKRLRIPEDLRQRNGLLVALIPLKTNSSKYWELQSHRRNQPPSQILPEEILLLENRYLKGDSSYSRAVQILQCPVWLEETIGEAPKRTFCIWFAPFDGTQKNNGKEITAGTETSALITILERANADNVGYKSDVWFVFVHIGALKTLHKFEAFSDRRVKRPELQFITYGSHPTVPKNRWGINEIYIMGGILTFTPNAIVENILYIKELIEKAGKHSLWGCYVLPSVLGLGMRIAEDKYDAETCKIIFEDVLKLITDGELSLFTAPALNISHGETLERRSAWRSFFYPPSSPEVMKQECEAAYNIKYANVSLDKTQTAILEEICNDLLSLQLQEEMSSFRRFVVISGTADGKVDATGNLVGEPHNWMEWHSISSFRFKDEESKMTTKTQKFC